MAADVCTTCKFSANENCLKGEQPESCIAWEPNSEEYFSKSAKARKHEFVDVEISCKECTSYKFCECIGYPLAVLQGEECFEYEYDYDKEN